jgi:hypothetical protein
VTINDLLGVIWTNARQNWHKITLEIDSGCTKLIEIDNYTGFYSHDHKRMLAELEYASTYFDLHANFEPKRRKQLELYFKYTACVDGAREISKIHDRLGLKTKFVELDLLLNVKNFKDWTLDSMNAHIETIVNVLIKMDTAEKLNCLSKFCDSFALVDWLRKNTGDIMGLKFLVDLTSVSGTDTNSDRDLLARALKDAGTAFAPLIYDLKITDNFSEFMQHCDKVWHFLADDRHVAEKLIAIGDKIGQLEEIKQKGNVEVTSLKRAKLFNETGVYVVESSPIGIDEPQVNLLRMECDSMQYNYVQLKELQNILMLVARKSNVDTNMADDDETHTSDYFIDIFDSVTRLCDFNFKLLHKYGCLLFDRFTMRVYCDCKLERLAAKQAQVEIVFGNYASNQRTVNVDNEPTNKILMHLCSFLDKCLNEWQSYINKLRCEYHCLNYLNMNQINWLRLNLTEHNGNNMANFNQIKWLLYNINPDFDADLLASVIDKSRIELKRKHTVSNQIVSQVSFIRYFRILKKFKSPDFGCFSRSRPSSRPICLSSGTI